MKYVGTYSDPKDIVTKDKLEAVASRVSTNEDNIAMAESDIDGLQTDVGTLKTTVGNVQTSLASKQDTVVGGASTITEDNLTASRALVSNSSGKVAVSTVTSTELGYLDGVTSNVQTQLDKKLEKAPVTSVNNKTGAVQLNASDVGALPADTFIPTVNNATLTIKRNSIDVGSFTANAANDVNIDINVPTGKADIGLSNVDNVKQYSATNPPPYPVTSVNGKTGAVSVNVPTVPSTTSLIKGDGSGGLMVAVAETDFASPVSMRKVTLTTAGWGSSTKQQTVAVPGILADGTKQKVICSPIDESYDSAWNSCYVQCVGHGADSLTFQCDEIPTAAIEVFVSIQPVSFAS